MKDNGYEFGGQWSTTLHVYQDKLDADASVQVAFNVDGGTDLEIVTSINAVYDGGRLHPADRCRRPHPLR